MLQVQGATVVYGKSPALRGVTIEVREGELVAVVGPNGAGKSTLLLAIVGVVPLASGDVSFEGRSVKGRAPERIARQGIALVPEGRRIFETLSVAENLRVGATVVGNAAVEDGLEEVFDLFPVLKRYYGANAGKLSGGEQQQLAIARALIGRPRLLLLDEPSLGLAPVIVERVFETLVRLQQAGLTVLMVEQFAARALSLADRGYVLREGSVALSGTGEELAQDLATETAFLGGAVAEA